MINVSGGQFQGPTQADIQQANLDRFQETTRQMNEAVQNFTRLREQKRQFDFSAGLAQIQAVAASTAGGYLSAAKLNPDLFKNTLSMVFDKKDVEEIYNGIVQGVYKNEDFQELIGGLNAMGAYQYEEEKETRGIPLQAPAQGVSDTEGLQAETSQMSDWIVPTRTVPGEAQEEFRKIPGGELQLEKERTYPLGAKAGRGRGEVSAEQAAIPYGEILPGPPSAPTYEAIPTSAIVFLKGALSNTGQEETSEEQQVQIWNAIVAANPQAGLKEAKTLKDVEGQTISRSLRNMKVPIVGMRPPVDKMDPDIGKVASPGVGGITLEPEQLKGLAGVMGMPEGMMERFTEQAGKGKDTALTQNGARRLRVAVDQAVVKSRFPNVHPSFLKDIQSGAAWLEKLGEAHGWKNESDVIKAMFIPESMLKQQENTLKALEIGNEIYKTQLLMKNLPAEMALREKEIEAKLVELDVKAEISNAELAKALAYTEYEKMRIEAAKNAPQDLSSLQQFVENSLAPYVKVYLEKYKKRAAEVMAADAQKKPDSALSMLLKAQQALLVMQLPQLFMQNPMSMQTPGQGPFTMSGAAQALIEKYGIK